MRLPAISYSAELDDIYDASGTIAVASTPQLLLGRSMSRSFLLIQPVGSGSLRIKFGCARAHATISGGKVTGITVDDAGNGFSAPPQVLLEGGGGQDGPFGNSSYTGLGQPGAPAPSNIATAHCVMTGSAPNMTISSIVVDNEGSNYLAAPYVRLINAPTDPNAYATPSDTSGIFILAGGPPFLLNGSYCPTTPIAIFSDTASAAFICNWAP